MTNRRCKILIYAEGFSWGMGPFLCSAFQSLGHDAELFDWTKWLYTANGRSLKNRVFDRFLFPVVAARINAALQAFVRGKKYDYVIVSKGLHLSPSTILSLKQCSKSVANWNPDDFFNPLNSSRCLRASFPVYDTIFTPRAHLIREYSEKGANRISPLDWYYLPETQFPMQLSQADKEKYQTDMVFIGSWSKRRETLLSALSHFNVNVWGGGWHKAASEFRRSIKCHGPIYREEMTKAICAAKININILTTENRDTTNIRNFEIPACRGFQLCERSQAIGELFKENQEIALFGTAQELVDKCAYYLSNPKEREAISIAGYQRVVTGENTITDRVKHILEVLNVS